MHPVSSSLPAKFELRTDKSPLLQYIRKSKKPGSKHYRQPIGVVMAQLGADGVIHIGYSKCNKKDSFDKHSALALAEIRMSHGRIHEISKLPYAVQELLPSFVLRAKKYFKSDLVRY